MAFNIYGAVALTGGGTGSLDSIDGNNLADKDVAVVAVQGGSAYFFVLDADSAATESSPAIISPDSNAGDKRWLLVYSYMTGMPAVPVASGGTGHSTYSTGELLIGNSGGTLSKNKLKAGAGLSIANSSHGTITLSVDNHVADGLTGQTAFSSGQLLIGNSGGTLTKATLTAGAGITITNASGAITIANTASVDPTPDSDHDFEPKRNSVTMTAGENVTIGQLCYIKSDGKMWKTDADAIASTSGIMLAGMTISANSAGTFILPGSFVRDDTWNWTVGGLIYADKATAGAMVQDVSGWATDDVIQVVGVATHADRMFFWPSLTQLEHV